MANITKIKLPSGDTYDIVDEKSGYITSASLPTKTSDLENDGDGSSAFATMDDIGQLGGGTITAVKTTAGAHTTINVTSGNASFNVPTKTSHLTNDSGFVTTDTKNTAGSTDIASGTIYLIGATSQAASPQTYSSDTLKFNPSNNLLTIGSSNNEGKIRLYGSTSNNYFTIIPDSTSNKARTITLPDATGTVALTSDITVSDVTLDGTSVVSSGIAALTSTAVSATDDGNGNVTLVISGVSAASGGSF